MTTPKTPRRRAKKAPDAAEAQGRTELTGEVREAILDLVRARPGINAQEVGKIVGVSTGAAHNVLRAGRARAAAEAARAATEAAGAVDFADNSVERLEQLARTLVTDAQGARAGGDSKGAAQVMGQALTALERLSALRPPPAKDPAADPTNIEARDTLVRKLRDLVEREEAGQRAMAPLAGMFPGGLPRAGR